MLTYLDTILYQFVVLDIFLSYPVMQAELCGSSYSKRRVPKKYILLWQKSGQELKDQLVRSVYTLGQTTAPENSGTLFKNHSLLTVYNSSLALSVCNK
jgi:hypothetical protein